MPIWFKEKLFLKNTPKTELTNLTDCKVKNLPKLMFAEHYQSHAASAFDPSSCDRVAVLYLDAVGEWATLAVYKGRFPGEYAEIRKLMVGIQNTIYTQHTRKTFEPEVL